MKNSLFVGTFLKKAEGQCDFCGKKGEAIMSNNFTVDTYAPDSLETVKTIKDYELSLWGKKIIKDYDIRSFEKYKKITKTLNALICEECVKGIYSQLKS